MSSNQSQTRNLGFVTLREKGVWGWPHSFVIVYDKKVQAHRCTSQPDHTVVEIDDMQYAVLSSSLMSLGLGDYVSGVLVTYVPDGGGTSTDYVPFPDDDGWKA